VAEGDAFEVAVEAGPAGGTVVHVAGDLDLATAPQLEEALSGRVEESGLVIDLSDCTFIDSTCVRVLVSVARETEEAGARTALVATDPGILRVLEITALDTLVPVHSTVDEALAVVVD
jgi:anti-anti-sigma factor